MTSSRVLPVLLAEYGSSAVSASEFSRRVAKFSSEPLDLLGLRLAFDCLRGSTPALRQLKYTLEKAVSGMRRNLVPTEDVRAELCQQAYVALLYGGSRVKRGYLLTYGGRAPLQAWLRTMLVRRGIAIKRRQDREISIDSEIRTLPSRRDPSDPELEVLRQDCAIAFQAAFQQSLTVLSRRDRLVLSFHLIDGLTAEQIAERVKVHRVTVARWMRRIRETLREGTRRNLAEMLHEDANDLDFIFTLVKDQLLIDASSCGQINLISVSARPERSSPSFKAA